jgi:hypothetical protein
MRLDASLAVEHVLPKKPEGVTEIIKSRELDWENFLLACTNCNSTKGDNNITLEEFYWPDRDNTFRAFAYSKGGIINPSTVADNEKARRTIELTVLDKRPLNNQTASDRRWLSRREVWDIAERAKNRLSNCNHTEMREQIVATAIGHGYWSVWMTIFHDDIDMVHRLINAFPGTATDCFDAENSYTPIHRPQGKI